MASPSMKHNGQVKWVADSPISGGPGIPSLFCQINEIEVLFEPFLDCAKILEGISVNCCMPCVFYCDKAFFLIGLEMLVAAFELVYDW
jgi:hypothetical protein